MFRCPFRDNDYIVPFVVRGFRISNFKWYIFVVHVDLSIKARSLFMNTSALSLELKHLELQPGCHLIMAASTSSNIIARRGSGQFKTRLREKINRPTKHDSLENFTAYLSSLAVNSVSNGRSFRNGTCFRQNQHSPSGCRQKPIPIARSKHHR